MRTFLSIGFGLFLIAGAFAQNKHIQPFSTRALFPDSSLIPDADSMRCVAILGDSRFMHNADFTASRLCFNRDESQVIVSGGRFISGFEIKTGQRLWTHEATKYQPYGGFIRGLCPVPHSNHILATHDGGWVGLLDSKTGEAVVRLDSMPEWPLMAAVSPDGRLAVVVGVRATARIHDLKQRSVRDLAAITDAQHSQTAKFSPSGRYLVTGTPNGFFVWDWQRERGQSYPTQSGYACSLGFSPTEDTLFVGTWGGVVEAHALDKPNCPLLWSVALDKSWISDLVFNPYDGMLLAVGSREIFALSPRTGKEETRSVSLDRNGCWEGVGLSANGQTLYLTTRYTRRIQRFNAQSLRPIPSDLLGEWAGAPKNLSFSNDGRYLAACAETGAVQIIALDSLRVAFRGVPGQPQRNFKPIWDKYSRFVQLYERDDLANFQQRHFYRLPDFAPFDEGASFQPLSEAARKAADAQPHLGQSGYYHSLNIESIEFGHVRGWLNQPLAVWGNLEDKRPIPYYFGGFSMDGERYAGVNNLAQVYVYEQKTALPRCGVRHPNGFPEGLAIHPFRELVAVASWDGLLYLYERREGGGKAK